MLILLFDDPVKIKLFAIHHDEYELGMIVSSHVVSTYHHHDCNYSARLFSTSHAVTSLVFCLLCRVQSSPPSDLFMFFLTPLKLSILSSNFFESFFVGVRLGGESVFVTRVQSSDDTDLQEGVRDGISQG